MTPSALAWVSLATVAAVGSLMIGGLAGLAGSGRPTSRGALALVAALALLPIAWAAAAALAPRSPLAPIAALVAAGRAVAVARVTRARSASALAERWVEAAIALGVPRWQLLTRYALPHALAPATAVAALTPAHLAIWSGAAAALGAPSWAGTEEWSSSPGALAVAAAVVASAALGAAVDRRAEAPWRSARRRAPLPQDAG